MKTRKMHRPVLIILILNLFLTLPGCAARPFGKPPGDNIGSCEGTMRLESGRRASFRIDLFTDDEDGKFYLTIPGLYRYNPIEDLDIDDGSLEIELASPKRTIEGEIIGDSLRFNGNFKGFSGSLIINLDDGD